MAANLKYLDVYNTPEWRKLSHAHLLLVGFRCQWPGCKACRARGDRICVHHKKPVKTHPELALDPYNLIAYCDFHHATQHPHLMKRYIANAANEYFHLPLPLDGAS